MICSLNQETNVRYLFALIYLHVLVLEWEN
jgi:hypothetical protein